MAKYRIEIKRRAVRDINKLQGMELRRILSSIEILLENPRPALAIKLTSEEIYRIRAGDYRILYEIFDKLVIVATVKVGYRREFNGR